MNKEEVEGLIQCIQNARVCLEQGGKYDWNEDLKHCDEWLRIAISKLLGELK